MSIIFALGATVGCTISTDTLDRVPPEARGNARPADLVIELKAENPVIGIEETPRFSAQLVNRGGQPITVVLPGDGSSDGWRTPVVRWTPEQRTGGRCGNINPLKADEVITLRPGERVPLSSIGYPMLPGPGTHTVSLELEHFPDLRWYGIPLGEHDAATMRTVQQTPGFRAVSNEVSVKVQLNPLLQ